MKEYRVVPVARDGVSSAIVRVPGSKSITNRAILLAALAEGESTIKGILVSNDSKDIMRCLLALGVEMECDEKRNEMHIRGCGGEIPVKKASINVGSAGTAARFITALLAVSKGEYYIDASEQMKKRPMKPLFDALIKCGVNISYKGEEGHFPVEMDSRAFTGHEISVDVGVSSQFLSGLLMAGALLKEGLTINITGARKSLPYVNMTAKVMESFGISVLNDLYHKNLWKVPCGKYRACDYSVEPDVSAACYFFALAHISEGGITVKVRNIHRKSLQGDIRFLDILEDMGAKVEEDSEGISVRGPKVYDGGTFDLNDFSDQALTLAALGLFAKSPVTITGIGHIRKQECDRINAIVTNARALGATCTEGEDFVTIGHGAEERREDVLIETYNDHRVAMAFAVAGLRREGVIIKNPDCTQKTFPRFFDFLSIFEAKQPK